MSGVASTQLEARRARRGEVARYFNEHVMQPSDGCRIWPFSAGLSGYPSAVINGLRIYAATCEAWHGPRPVGHQAAHSCGNKRCWAGEHLRWATPAENQADRILHGTAGNKSRRREIPSGRRAEPRERKSVLHSLNGAAAMIRSNSQRITNGEGGLAELAALAEIVRDAQAAQDEVVRFLLEHDDASLREIGTALGVSRQAVGARYRGVSARTPGGQPSHLR